MGTALSVALVVHVLNAILMAWPFYALVSVNQRVRLGPPLGDRADTYMENIIKSRTVPCFVFQGTALVTGIALVLLRGLGLAALISSPVIASKFFLLLLIIGLLTHVHTRLQPRIDALFASAGGGAIPADIAKQIAALRLRRKRIASICLFVVLTIATLGVEVWNPFPLWLTSALVIAIALFAWHSYKSLTRYGWI